MSYYNDNLFCETICKLEENNKNVSDVEWVGITYDDGNETKVYFTWE